MGYGIGEGEATIEDSSAGRSPAPPKLDLEEEADFKGKVGASLEQTCCEISVNMFCWVDGDENAEDKSWCSRQDTMAPVVNTTVGILLFLMFMFFPVPFSDADRFEPYELTDAFFPLRLLFGLMILNLPVAIFVICIEEKMNSKVLMIYRFSCVALAILIIFEATELVETKSIFKNVKDFNSLEDEQVQKTLTFNLAVFSTCCFDPANATNVAPDLECAATNNTEPCFEDQDLFDTFIADLEFDSKLCRTAVPAESGSKASKGGRSSNDFRRLNEQELCDLGEREYVIFLSAAVEKTLLYGVTMGIVIGLGVLLHSLYT